MELEEFFIRNYTNNVSDPYVWEATKDFEKGYLLANLLSRKQISKQKNSKNSN